VLKTSSLLILTATLASAEVHRLTLHQAVEIALQQNPDMVLARLDEKRAQDAVRIAKDPFVPKVYGGSGLAYTSGYPNSIEGNAPSIFEAKTSMAIFNRPKSYELAEQRENARTAAISSQSKADDVAFQTATNFLDVQQLANSEQSLQREVEALQRVADSVKLRVNEGRELALDGKRADLDLARTRQRFQALEIDLEYGEASLATVLGYPASDRVEPVAGENAPPEIPDTAEAVAAIALQNSKEIRRLESQLQAKGLEVRSYRSYRLPQLDLVAQYALFDKQAYSGYFSKFQRNNGQLGVSIQIPLLVGSASAGYLGQAETDVAKLRAQINSTRNRIALDAQRNYRELKKAESARDVSKLDLEVARDQVNVLIAQMTEGRATQQAIEQARFAEDEKWIAFYEAQHTLERARMDLLHQTGTIIAALK
jgi:outer membrane protein TolC